MRALLLIADIGGYTRFMTVHRVNLAHAHDVVSQLLEAVIDAAPRGFTLAKLEGDAAFFYAELPEGKDAELAQLGPTVTALRRGFRERQQALELDRLCSCDGCVQVDQLNLKFVSHVGEIVLRKVKRFEEVAGVDVIHVHRLLKNSVPVKEYVLMSEPLAEKAGPLAQQATAVTEHLEGLGETKAFWVDLSAAEPALPPRAPSPWRRLLAWAAMTWRSLPYFVGAKRACDGFRNVDPKTLAAGAQPGAGS